jgi:outer membrane protein assembly factor BamA
MKLHSGKYGLGVLAVWAVLAGLALAQRSSPLPAPVASATDGSQAAPAAVGGIDAYLGLRVRQIQFRGGLGEAAQQRMRQLIQQRENEPLDRGKLRRSLHALYATGRFADLQVEAERAAQGEVLLVFSARPNFFVGDVEVEGAPRRPAAHQLVSAAKLQLGELYTRDKVDTAVRNLQTVMTDNGYYQAQIQPREQFHPETQQVDISFQLNPGGHARIGEVTIEGQSGYSDHQIEGTTGFQTGRPVTGQRMTKGLQKLRRKYQKQGRLEAQVAVKEQVYHPALNRVNYQLQINRGPLVDIQVDGVRIGHGKLKALVPIFQEGTVDDDLLNEGLRNLRDYFQTQGYFDVRLNWEQQTAADGSRLDVVYHVDLGGKHKLVAIRIDGNKAFDTDLIRERMQIKPAGKLFSHGRYSESLLNRDVELIQATLYKANGFSHARIERVVTDNYQGGQGHILVTLRIDEGPQVTVNRVTLSGNRSFDRSTLDTRLANQGAGLVTLAGQPFSEANVAQDRDVLMGFYFNNGFPDVQVDAAAAPAGNDPNRMDVAFTVREGERVLVDQVLISGLNYTHPYVIQRVLGVHPDMPLSQLGMLESQRSLYDLGLFNQVDMAVQNPGGSTGYKNVLFQIQEAKRWTFNYGFGFELQTAGQPLDVINSAPAPGITLPKNTVPASGISFTSNPQSSTDFSPSVGFELTRINFRGRDDTVSLKTHLSNLQKRALFTYSAPHWIDREGLRFTFSGLYDDSRDVRTFASQRLEGAAQAEQVITHRSDGQPITSLLFRYSYRRVKVDASTLAISAPLIPLLSKPVLLGMPSFTYIRDHRDNVLDPRRGTYTTFDLGISAKAFGSGSVNGTAGLLSNGVLTPSGTAANFTRLGAQNSNYAVIWRNPHVADRGIVLAHTTRIGTENVLGAGASGLTIPLPERFFAGGTSFDRGFALNQAGPRDLTTGFPLGGSAIFLNSFELRFPPPTLPLLGDNVAFVLFHDLGNVFQSGTDMIHSFSRWQQPNRLACGEASEYQTCRFDYMSQALGTGVRYKTPIGPIRGDVSYNLNPPSFPYFVCPVGANCSDPNVLIFQHGTLRHFNFIFSIGQSF